MQDLDNSNEIDQLEHFKLDSFVRKLTKFITKLTNLNILTGFLCHELGIPYVWMVIKLSEKKKNELFIIQIIPEIAHE